MTTSLTLSSVRLRALSGRGQPEPTPELERLYRGFEQELLVPLWTEIGDLMPQSPNSKAAPHLWRWDRLKALAAQARKIVPVGRGGERRAIALANPALGGRPFAMPTLWAAIQYLMPGEDAPEHRHTQHAFRLVLEGEGVWTVVNGDPVRMSRGDFLPQAGGDWHSHHNAATEPMAWIDGLDIPFSYLHREPVLRSGAREGRASRAQHARTLAVGAAVGREAPGVALNTVRNAEVNLRDDMESGKVDLAIGLLPQLKAGFFQRRLFRQRYVCLFRRGHALDRPRLTLADYKAADHLAIVSPGTGHGKVDELIRNAGIERTVRLTVPHFVSLGHILQRTALVATVPERLAQTLVEPFGLALHAHPLKLPDVPSTCSGMPKCTGSRRTNGGVAWSSTFSAPSRCRKVRQSIREGKLASLCTRCAVMTGHCTGDDAIAEPVYHPLTHRAASGAQNTA